MYEFGKIYFPDAKPGLLSTRSPNTVEHLIEKGLSEQKTPDYVLPYLSPDASMEWVRKLLPPLDQKEKGVVKVADVVRAMWLMAFRGPIVNLAKMHKKRVALVKKTLFEEGGKILIGKALAKKIGKESAKELLKKLTIVKALFENMHKADKEDNVLRAATGRTIGEFIATRLAYPKKYTRFTRATRTRK